MRKLIIISVLLIGCTEPQEIKEDPNKDYKDSIQRRIDSCQAVIDSVELEKKKLGL